jgi:hypothetical protein
MVLTVGDTLAVGLLAVLTGAMTVTLDAGHLTPITRALYLVAL